MKYGWSGSTPTGLNQCFASSYKITSIWCDQERLMGVREVEKISWKKCKPKSESLSALDTGSFFDMLICESHGRLSSVGRAADL